jgi:hypothetical protein
MQLLCTLRDHRRQWPRNTRYQADATPYLGRTFTGWIAPAYGWAHLFDHLVGARQQGLGNGEAKRLRSLEVDNQFVLGWSLDRQVGWLLALEDAMDVTCRASKLVDPIRSI